MEATTEEGVYGSPLTDISSTDSKSPYVAIESRKCPICGVSVFSLMSLDISRGSRVVEYWECSGCGSPTEVYR